MKVSKLKGILASYHGNTDVVKVFDDMKFTTLVSLKKAIDESVNNRNDHNVIDVIMNELDSRRQKNGSNALELHENGFCESIKN